MTIYFNGIRLKPNPARLRWPWPGLQGNDRCVISQTEQKYQIIAGWAGLGRRLSVTTSVCLKRNSSRSYYYS